MRSLMRGTASPSWSISTWLEIRRGTLESHDAMYLFFAMYRSCWTMAGSEHLIYYEGMGQRTSKLIGIADAKRLVLYWGLVPNESSHLGWGAIGRFRAVLDTVSSRSGNGVTRSIAETVVTQDHGWQAEAAGEKNESVIKQVSRTERGYICGWARACIQNDGGRFLVKRRGIRHKKSSRVYVCKTTRRVLLVGEISYWVRRDGAHWQREFNTFNVFVFWNLFLLDTCRGSADWLRDTDLSSESLFVAHGAGVAHNWLAALQQPFSFHGRMIFGRPIFQIYRSFSAASSTGKEISRSRSSR